MLVDAHCHIQFPAYDEDRDEVIARAKAGDVKMIAVGTQEATSLAAIALAEKYPDWIWAAIGFHPNHLSAEWHHDRKEQAQAEQEKFQKERFLEIARHPKVVAIGECGLDYYRLSAGHEKDEKVQQLEVFSAQGEIAEKVGKALMIHCRPSKGTDDAYEDLLSFIEKRDFSIPKILHFYVGSPTITKKFVDAGFYFTFGGVVTFARDYDEIIQSIPLDRILSETDAPYVAPEPFRGSRNEPLYISKVVESIARIKGISGQRTSAQLYANAQVLFPKLS